MIVYEGKCEQFIKDCLVPSENEIQDIIKEKTKVLSIPSGDSEYNSWMHSLPAFAKVLRDYSVPDDSQIGIEYQIKGDKHRIDAMICGADESGGEVAVIIELKQWSTANRCEKPFFVHTIGGAGEDDYWHPSYQAANYAGIIDNYYEYVQTKPVKLRSCSYLHNMPEGEFEILGDSIMYPGINQSPVFLKGDEKKLADFIKQFIKKPCKDLLFRIEHSDICPSPKLSDMLYDSMKGKPFFSYSEEQANAVSSIVQYVRDSNKYGEKRTIVIKGRPGTGKSIVALNALGQIIHPENKENDSLLAVYCTSTTAPRELYKKVLLEGDSDQYDEYAKMPLIELFKSPLKIRKCPENSIPCVLFDEAHRMYNWKGGVGVEKGVKIIEECIKASKVSVFFLDEDQAVTVHDELVMENLREMAEKQRSRLIEGPTLVTQFRVIGGNNYIQFIRHILRYGDTMPPMDFGDYDVKVFDSASEMREALRKKNEEYGSSRMVAGYTYEWETKGDYLSGYDIKLDGGRFKARWNMSKMDYSWLYDKNSFEDVGCIHTCQGLDMQYCGVIIGKDVRYEGGNVIFDQTKLAKSDRSSGIRTCKDPLKAIRLIRNTYNVLLTRGMRGTYIYCEDKSLNDYIKTELKNILKNNHEIDIGN